MEAIAPQKRTFHPARPTRGRCPRRSSTIMTAPIVMTAWPANEQASAILPNFMEIFVRSVRGQPSWEQVAGCLSSQAPPEIPEAYPPSLIIVDP